MNKIILIGHLGKDPEAKTLDSGTNLTTFSMATSESYKNKDGEKVTTTEWHNIVLWRGLAEIAAKYLTKGSHVMIEGKSTTRKWEDKDGNARYTTEVIGSNMEMLGGKPQEKNESGEASSEGPRPEPQEKKDDLPF